MIHGIFYSPADILLSWDIKNLIMVQDLHITELSFA